MAEEDISFIKPDDPASEQFLKIHIPVTDHSRLDLKTIFFKKKRWQGLTSHQRSMCELNEPSL